MKATAYISDYNNPPFKVTGTLRTSEDLDMYIIVQEDKNTRILPLHHRVATMYVEDRVILKTHNEKVTFRDDSVPKLKGGM
uniref:Uncharacterized protein n=1 Tax=viral metagenome TaxID=1070528 RepID=A0A6M3L3U4_9ZZZZ